MILRYKFTLRVHTPLPRLASLTTVVYACFVTFLFLFFCVMIEQAQPIFKDPKRFPDMADPALERNFPEKDLNQVVAIAAMCLQEEAGARPLMSDVVTALSFLSMIPSASGTPNG